MRALPAFSIVVTRHAGWNAAVAAAAACAFAALASWLADRPQPDAVGWLAAGGAALLVAAATIGAWQRGSTLLRWDGAGWSLAPEGAAALACRVGVAIDLGGWLLLRCRLESGPTRWLAVQRGGLEAHWHALRFAVYSARPNARPAAGTER